MNEKKPKPEELKQEVEEKDADRKPEESHIVDITDEFIGQSLVFTGAKKP